MAFSFLLNNDQTKHKSTSNCSKIKEPSLSNEVFLEVSALAVSLSFILKRINNKMRETNATDYILTKTKAETKTIQTFLKIIQMPQSHYCNIFA